MHHTHSGEDITVTFKRNGRYDDDGLKKVNWFLRDWRTNEPTTMDPQLLDAVWEVQREFGKDKVIHIISAYRSPNTNAMLRSRSGGRRAHIRCTCSGKAMDFHIPGVPLEDLRAAGLRLQRGGVGFYPSSGSPFVHMDVGNVRHWPRMTREQLVRVFPNQRTVHLPTDGQPLAGYALALADHRETRRQPVRGDARSRRQPRRRGEAEYFRAHVRRTRPRTKRTTTEAGSPDARALFQPARASEYLCRRRRAEDRTGRSAQSGIAVPPTSAPAVAATPTPKARPATSQVAAAAPQPEKPARPRKARHELSARGDHAERHHPCARLLGRLAGRRRPENSAARRRPAGTASADPDGHREHRAVHRA